MAKTNRISIFIKQGGNHPHLHLTLTAIKLNTDPFIQPSNQYTNDLVSRIKHLIMFKTTLDWPGN